MQIKNNPQAEQKPALELRVETNLNSNLEAPETTPAPVLPSVLENIAWCESRNRHYDKNGKVLRGEKNPYDIGKYQINVLYWGNEAKKLGIDLHTEEGNEAMALAIYQKYGTAPWKWSKSCWSKEILAGN